MSLPVRLLFNRNLLASKKTIRSAAVKAGVPFKGSLPNDAVDIQKVLEFWIATGIFSIRKRYTLLDGKLTVTADSKKLTASLVSGVLTITVPEGELYMVEYNGLDSEVNADNFPAQPATFKVVVDYSYDNDRNTTLDDLQKIQTAAWDYSLVDTTISDSAYVSELGVFEVPRKITGANSNTLTTVFEGLNLYSKWGISVIYGA